MEERRSEQPNTRTGGKKIRQRSKRKRRDSSVRQPRRFEAPGTEVNKDA